MMNLYLSPRDAGASNVMTNHDDLVPTDDPAGGEVHVSRLSFQFHYGIHVPLYVQAGF